MNINYVDFFIENYIFVVLHQKKKNKDFFFFLDFEQENH